MPDFVSFRVYVDTVNVTHGTPSSKFADYINFKVYVDTVDATYRNPSSNFVGNDYPKIKFEVWASE